MTEIYLSGKNLGDEGVCTWLEELRDDVECRILMLSHNNLSCVPELTKYHQFNKLKELYLDFNYITCLTVDNVPKSTKILSLQCNKQSELSNLSAFHSLTELDLSGNQISVVQPGHLPRTLTHLSLNKNRLSECGDFSQHTKIRVLMLCDNQISVVEPGCIPQSATELDLGENKIIKLPNLGELNLRKLGLRGNKIYTINPDYLSRSLTWLDLEENNITELPRLGGFKSLNKLWLKGNQIGTVNPDCLPRSLTWLDLTENKITELPHLSDFTNLSKLWLKGNQIYTVRPDYLPRSLTLLYLRNNKIKELPHLDGLTSLSKLSLRGNQIYIVNPAYLPRSLTVLSLSKNKITNLHHLGGFRNLRKLSLKGNRICKVNPNYLPRSLTLLHLAENKITELPHLGGFLNLSKLSLKGNQIYTVNPDHLPRSLTVLGLQKNKITELPHLDGFTNLSKLWLSGNEICTVNPDYLPRSLTLLHLEENKITELPHLGGFTNLRELWLQKNLINAVNNAYLPRSLTVLDLQIIKITELQDLGGFLNLIKLLLIGNNLESIHGLPKSLRQLTIQSDVKVLGVKCFHKGTYDLLKDKINVSSLQQPPPEVFARGLAAVLEYYEEEGYVKTSLGRILTLGPAGAGKSSVVESVIEQQPVMVDKDNRTHVADLRTWHISATDTVQIFDEGGHDVYSITAPVFSTPNAIRLLVHDLVKIHDADLTKTVNIFHQALNQHPQNQILVVLTHIDMLDDTTIENNKGIVKDALKDTLDDRIQLLQTPEETKHKYTKKLIKMLKHQRDGLRYFCVSSGTFKGFAELIHFLKETVKQKRVTIPEKWVDFYKLICKEDSMFLKLEYLMMMFRQLYSSSQNLFQKTKISSKCLHAIAYFRDAGLFLFYDDIPQLKEYVFHKPEFIISLLQSTFHLNLASALPYETDKVFTTKLKKEQLHLMVKQYLEDGLLCQKLLNLLWQKYSLENQDQKALLELLKSFTLCYPVTADSELLYFPWFVENKICPDAVDPKCLTKFGKGLMSVQFDCIFLGHIPQNVFEMMMVQLQKTALDRGYTGERYSWRDGLLIKIGTLEYVAVRQEEALAISFCVRGDTREAEEIWTTVSHIHHDLQSILSAYKGIIEAIYFLCNHCILNHVTPINKRHPEEVLHPKSPNVAKLTCKAENVPRALIVAFSEKSKNIQRDIQYVEEYLEKKISETAVPGKLLYLDCKPLCTTEFELSWGWPLCKVVGDPHAIITDNTITHAVVWYKEDHCWKKDEVNVATSPYIFEGRATEFCVAAHNKNGRGEFQFVTPLQVVKGDEMMSEEDRDLMKVNNNSFCRMYNVREIIIRLFSRRAIDEKEKETLIRKLIRDKEYLTAVLLLEILDRKTYEKLYLFKKTLKETGQTVLARTVPVHLVAVDQCILTYSQR